MSGMSLGLTMSMIQAPAVIQRMELRLDLRCPHCGALVRPDPCNNNMMSYCPVCHKAYTDTEGRDFEHEHEGG